MLTARNGPSEVLCRARNVRNRASSPCQVQSHVRRCKRISSFFLFLIVSVYGDTANPKAQRPNQRLQLSLYRANHARAHFQFPLSQHNFSWPLEHNHAWVHVLALRVQPGRGQQLSRLAVMEIHVALAFPCGALRDKSQVTAIHTERRCLLMSH